MHLLFKDVKPKSKKKKIMNILKILACEEVRSWRYVIVTVYEIKLQHLSTVTVTSEKADCWHHEHEMEEPKHQAHYYIMLTSVSSLRS